ncbi:MAG: hypothetical protein LBT16_06630 [Treponema sp.]|jgi:hypothetical protein|nr:hypothetical protein [Treponema sp.]
MGKKGIIALSSLGVLIILILTGARLFFSRPPVLVVSDLSIEGIYGPSRLFLKQAELSLKLRRPVRNVRVSNDAGEDVVVFTIESASENPFCVLFPYHYNREARRYAREYPGVPVGILVNRYPDIFPPEEGTVTILATDPVLDFYRAGRCAAILAQAGLPGAATGETAEGAPSRGDIQVFYDDPIPASAQEAFKQGLEEEGYEFFPLYLSGASDYQAADSVSCAVIYGSAAGFLEKNPRIPVVLFSWIDPANTPNIVKVIADDSPWTLAIPAVKIITGEEDNKEIPSVLTVFNRRLGEKERAKKIKRAALGLLPKENE